MTFVTAYLIAIGVLFFVLTWALVCQGDGFVVHVLYRQFGMGIFVAIPASACFQAWIIMLFPVTMITVLSIGVCVHLWVQYKYRDMIRDVLRRI